MKNDWRWCWDKINHIKEHVLKETNRLMPQERHQLINTVETTPRCMLSFLASFFSFLAAFSSALFSSFQPWRVARVVSSSSSSSYADKLAYLTSFIGSVLKSYHTASKWSTLPLRARVLSPSCYYTFRLSTQWLNSVICCGWQHFWSYPSRCRSVEHCSGRKQKSTLEGLICHCSADTWGFHTMP